VETFELEEVSVANWAALSAPASATVCRLPKSTWSGLSRSTGRRPERGAGVKPRGPGNREQLDRELAAGQDRGPLHGIPVLLKDNIATGDRMTTTAAPWPGRLCCPGR